MAFKLEEFPDVERLNNTALVSAGKKAARFIDISSGATAVGALEMSLVAGKIINQSYPLPTETLPGIAICLAVAGLASLNFRYQSRFITVMSEALDRKIPLAEPRIY